MAYREVEVILPHADYDESHLESVMAKMRTLGAPEIRGVWSEAWGIWVALEGSHRLRAAHALGLTPKMIEVDYDDDTTTEDLGLDYQDNLLVADIVKEAWKDAEGCILTFSF